MMEATQIDTLPHRLAKKAEESIFFLGTAGLGFHDMTSHLHYEMCHVVMEAEDVHWVLMLVPRNHYKSSICTISYPIWRGVRNPNETGLIITNTARNALKFGTRIRDTWEGNPFIRNWWPHLRPEFSSRWNKEEMTLPRTQDHPEATWTFAGWDTRVTSGHWDYIIFDDLVDEETFKNPELMQKLIERFEQRISGLLRPPVHKRTVLVVMNHWSPIDLACYILNKHKEFKVYYRQAIEDSKPIFPEKYDLGWLLRKQEIDPYTFANQYMNNPADESISENKLVWLQKYKRLENGLKLPEQYNDNGNPTVVPIGKMNIYAAVDPRHSLSTTTSEKLTSRNAIVVAGIDAQDRRYVLAEYAARSAPEELLKKMLEIHREWRPIKMGIESFGFQKMLEPLARLVWRGESNTPNLELLPHDTVRSKDTRIRGGCRVFAEGKGFSHHLLPYFNEEFLTFPNCPTKDVVDCWAWCMQMMNVPASDADYALQARVDRDHLKGIGKYGGIS